MKKVFKYFIFFFAFTACNTVAHQQRKAETFIQEHPERLAQWCSQTFTVDTVFKQDATIVKADTTVIKGDSIPCPAVVNAKGDTVYYKVKCPDSKIVHDTISKIETFTVDASKAKVAYLTYQRDSAIIAAIATTTLLNDRNKALKKDTIIVAVLGLAVVAGAILKIKNII